MNRWRFRPTVVALLITAGWLAGVAGQQPPALPLSTNFTRGVRQPPTPPPGKCPVELFRQLLAMTPVQRREAVASRPEGSQALLLAKVQEYENLPAEQRELRLKATELRWYLLPLLSAPSADRRAQLASIPAGTRKLVADRLEAWDRLPPAEQSRLREPAANYLAKEAARAMVPPPLPPLPPDRKLLLQAGVRQWQALSEEQRDDFTNRFFRVLSFTPQEKAKILSVLPEGERQQIQITLEKFQNLTDAQRAICISSFAKFASLSLEERDQFLKNAEHWKLMSTDERKTWTELVNRLEVVPPLPPGFKSPGLPPMPPSSSAGSPDGQGVVGSNR